MTNISNNKKLNMAEPNPEDFGLKDYTKYFSPKENELKNIKSELNIQISKSEPLVGNLKNQKWDYFFWLIGVALGLGMFLLSSIFMSIILLAPIGGLLMLFGFKEGVYLLIAFLVCVIGFFFNYIREATFKYESSESKLNFYLKDVEGKSYDEKINRLRKSLNQVERMISYKEALKKYERQKAETGEDWWRTLSSYELEEAVASLFKRKGFQASVTKKSGDGGVDVIVRSSDKTLLIQCKGWESKVGVKPIREMAGVVQHHTEKDCVGIILSTNGFTSEAIKFANQSKTLLWDSKTLSEVAKDQYEI
jgi:HJR/Mrr/RecB family endonuclease